MPKSMPTPEQRATGLEHAMAARRCRAALLQQLRDGTLTLAGLFEIADADRVAARIKLRAALEALPGVGPVTADRWCMTASVNGEKRRLGGVGTAQRKSLVSLAEQQVTPHERGI